MSLTRRTRDAAALRAIKIGPGEHFVTRDPGEIIVTVLGSCVAACIRDPLAGVGGMNHFMLPASRTGTWGQGNASMRFGNFAMERLINDILRRGGVRHRLEVKVFGGGAMMASSAAIGQQNADFVEAYLAAENMPIAACHLRGMLARRVEYVPLSGRVRMLELRDADAGMLQAELRLRDAPPPDDGGVELFD